MKARIVCMLLSAMIAGTGFTEISSADINNQTTGQSEVIYEQESNFTVTIPKKIALSSDKSAEYSVTVSGSVGAGESVSVVPDSEFIMNETGGRKTAVKGVATQDDTVWDYEQIEAGDAKTGNVSASGLTAGDWSGSLRFNINLKSEKFGDDVTLGLYSIATYDLVHDGSFVIPEIVTDSKGVKHRVVGFNNMRSDVDTTFHITSIVIPASCTTLIGNNNNPFSGYSFPYLTNITVSEDNPKYCSVNGVLFNKDKTTLVAYPAAKQETAYQIPDGVVNIGGAFGDCGLLTDVVMPNTVTKIGYAAFGGCKKLKNVTMSTEIVAIEDYAFFNCVSLDVTIPDTVTKIGSNAFTTVSHITYHGTAAGSPWGARSIN